MKANMSCNHEQVIVYNKNEEIIWAGKTKLFIKEYWQKLTEILHREWEYKSPYHDDKAQLEIPFKF